MTVLLRHWKLSVVERCPYWRGVLTERFDCSYRDFRETAPPLNNLPIVRAGSKRYTRFGNPLPRPSEAKLFLSVFYHHLVVSESE